MKASVYEEYGSPSVLQIKKVKKPGPKDNEVLIKVYATTVNRTDCAMLRAKPFIMRFSTGLWEEEGLPFASGGVTHQFVFCPVFISALVIIKTRKMLKAGCRSFEDVIAKVETFGERFGICFRF